MIGSRRRPLHVLSCACVLLSVASAGVAAQDTFDCKVTIGENKWDLSSLGGEHTLSRERDAPPTKFRDDVTFNLCEDLTQKDDVAEKDQCPSGTRACLTKTNLKDNEGDRITEVVRLATSDSGDVEYTATTSSKGLSLSFKGSSHPDPVTSEPIPQSFKVDIFCTPGETQDPTFKSYDGKELVVEWRAEAGCNFAGTDPEKPPPGSPPETKPDPDEGEGSERSMGSGLGYFFLLLILALAAYFGLGAYYNYSTYGATGLDLIPHRDFWREVPYMLRDVVSHLCSSVRPRSQSSRGGYIAV